MPVPRHANWRDHHALLEFKEKVTTPGEYALITIEGNAAEQDLRDAIRAERDGDGRVTYVNDVLGHAAIIAYFDKAIAGK